MTDILESSVTVPGGRLRFFLRGSGPLLLLVPGGSGDASKAEALARHLADAYAVLTYDRRGLSGSATEQPARTVAEHAEDASRLLAALADQPAHVFGSSLGGAIALSLAAAHPEQVSTVIPHEPAVTNLLPTPARATALGELEGVEDAFARAGVAAALSSFAALAGIDPEDREPEVERGAPNAQQIADMEFFVAHDLPALRAHAVDLDALRRVPARVVPAVGLSSAHLWPAACARLLARGLGVGWESLPGGHTGYVLRPRETAERVRALLTA